MLDAFFLSNAVLRLAAVLSVICGVCALCFYALRSKSQGVAAKETSFPIGLLGFSLVLTLLAVLWTSGNAFYSQAKTARELERSLDAAKSGDGAGYLNGTGLPDLAARLARRSSSALYPGAAAFLILPIAWYFSFRSIRRWREELEKARIALLENEKQLQRSIGEIEMSQTEAMKARKAQEAETKKLKAIMDNVLEGIITINSRGIIQTFNEAAERIFGFMPGEVIGKNVSVLVPTPHKERHDGYIKRYLETGKETIIGSTRELMGERKDGSRFPIVLSVSKVEVAGECLFVGLVRDISQQKEKQEELRLAGERAEAARQAAEKANAAKSEFLANMSHELRTPLNSILGMLRLLKESRLDEEQADLADTAFRSSVNLLEIVNDILDLSKIEAGEMQLERIGMDLSYCLSSVTHALSHIAAEKHILLLQRKEAEPFPYVLGDPTRFTRIVMNLAGNGIKYTDQGQVEIAASCKYADASHIVFRCEITDTGIGIPKSKQQSIFEKFIQADTSTTRKYGGTGLGLAITKQLVEMMGGTIGVESEEGAGSTFWFTIPFDVTAELNKEKQIRRKKMFQGSIAAEAARILVAEDHPMNQMLIKKLLKRFGIEHFEVVENGLEVLKRHREDAWDAVLMDCHMPGKNGYDATREIRAFEAGTGAHVPIVAMTANAMVGDKEKCLRYGMDEYISKPVSFEELREVLGQWICFKESGSGTSPGQAPADGSDPVLDFTILKSFSEGNKEIEREYIAIFLMQSDENMRVLLGLGKDGGLKSWQGAAHMFKGGALGIGATKLGKLCSEAQNFRGSEAEQAALFEKIRAEYERVKDYLRQIGLTE